MKEINKHDELSRTRKRKSIYWWSGRNTRGSKKHGITEVFDLRAGGEEPEGFPAGTKRHAYPIVEGVEGQDESVRKAIAAVKEAFEQDKKVFFHCSGGRNRTGTVATGLLLALGHILFKLSN